MNPIASLFLEIVRGGPLAGLPGLSLYFDDPKTTLDAEPLALLLSMSPPPLSLTVVWIGGATGQQESLAALFNAALARGMAITVEAFEILPWMLDRMIARRVFHTREETVSFPVEEIVFHTKEPPRFRPYPFHVARPPKLWWVPPVLSPVVLDQVPLGVALWTPQARLERLLYPKEG